MELPYNNNRTWELRLCIRYVHSSGGKKLRLLYVHSQEYYTKIVSDQLQWACQCGYSGRVSAATLGVSVRLQWACQGGYSGCVSAVTVSVSVRLQ